MVVVVEVEVEVKGLPQRKDVSWVAWRTLQEHRILLQFLPKKEAGAGGSVSAC